MIYQQQTFDEERALYGVRDVEVLECLFAGPADGESALKESRDITVKNSAFELRYPFWHVTNGSIHDCVMTQGCRAALWYDENILLAGCQMDGVKALRECRNITLSSCRIHSPEFAWRCSGLKIEGCELESEYPFFECKDMEISGLSMTGKYSFQYVENVTVRNCELHTKDAFWHSKNVTVEDSVIQGEYLGWYSENLRLVRCKIVGTQPLCYARGLVLEDCTTEGADLAFEKSDVRARIRGHVISVKNPASGSIEAGSIGEIVLDEDRKDTADCRIVQRDPADSE